MMLINTENFKEISSYTLKLRLKSNILNKKIEIEKNVLKASIMSALCNIKIIGLLSINQLKGK